jgi:hypothetical protein
MRFHGSSNRKANSRNFNLRFESTNGTRIKMVHTLKLTLTFNLRLGSAAAYAQRTA